MRQLYRRFITPLFAVSAAITVALFSGCGDDKSNAATDRTKDEKYHNELTEIREKQKKIASGNSVVVAEMQKILERARKALPAGATDEQVLAEIGNNPDKYPGWKMFYERSLENKAAIERNLAEARAKVRARIHRERLEKKAAK